VQKYVVSGAVALAVIAIAWWLLRERDAAPEPAPPAEVPVTVEPAARVEPPAVAEPSEPPMFVPQPEPDWVLPPLNESDPFVRERLEELDVPESWRNREELVRRLAVLLENASRGDYPRRQFAFLVPQESFRVIERDGRVYLDPASYERLDGVVDRLVGIDPAAVARLLGFVSPLVEQALTELGVSAPPGRLANEAIRQCLAVPRIDGDIELVQPNVMYQYADPALESLTPLQKLLLRTGPRNVGRVQAYLRALARALNAPA
jgi:hypothetical protein